MLDSNLASMVRWFDLNSIAAPSSIDGRRGRALLCMRSDGALRSIVLKTPDARTIFDLCGTLTSHTAYVVETSTGQGAINKCDRKNPVAPPPSPPASPPVMIRDVTCLLF